MRKLRKKSASRSGQAMVEYVVLIIPIALVAVFVVSRYKDTLRQKYCQALAAVVQISVRDTANPASDTDLCGVSAGGSSVPAAPTPTPVPPPPPLNSVTFHNPMFDGLPVADCLSYTGILWDPMGEDSDLPMHQCGQPAADVFCANQGFSKATDFAVETVCTFGLTTGFTTNCSLDPTGQGLGIGYYAFAFVTCQK